MAVDSDGNEASRQTLRKVLLERYDALARRLTRRLGSADLAGDALHDTWLRLERGGNFGVVRDPFAYLLRSATNADHQRQRLEERRSRLLEGHAIVEPVETPDPARALAERSEWDAMKLAIAGLPERRRAIFLAAWSERIPLDVIARRHGVSVRTIQSELKRALEELAAVVRGKP
jgi:RNA polymerase sigma-70 factor, ECF subfamily